MRSAAVAMCTALALFPAAATAQEATGQPEVVRTFAPGGVIYLDLSAGDYTVKGTDDGVIRVTWNTRDGNRSSGWADIQVQGTKATIRTRGPRNRFNVQIELPRRSDLDMTLSAGELDLRDVEGNKRLSMWAGEATMQLGDADLYKRVDATVRAGEISAPPLGRSTGGLFRSLHWDGKGKYTVSASLLAGEIKLVR